MTEKLQRRRLVAGLAASMAGVAGVLRAGRAIAASKTYKYRCPKCKLIQEYGTIGTKKCPNDGKTMIRVD